MEIEPQDQDIAGLLSKLKNAEPPYPEHMFVARRQMYLKRMGEIGMAIGTGAEGRQAAKDAPSPAASSVSSTLLEAALVVAMIVEASAVAYFYRDKLANFFQTITSEPVVQQVTPAGEAATAVAIEAASPSPIVTPTVPTVALSSSPTVTPGGPTMTPIPGLADENHPGMTNNSAGAGAGPSNATPAPNQNNNDDQGNHYGQTPKPERTKDAGNNSDSNNNGGSSQNTGTNGGGNDQGAQTDSRPPRPK